MLCSALKIIHFYGNLVNLRTFLYVLNYWHIKKCKIQFLLLPLTRRRSEERRVRGFAPLTRRILHFLICKIQFLLLKRALSIELIDFVVITCMINYSCWILMRCYFFTCIVVIHTFLIDSSTWLCISLFLQSNEFIWWTFGMNVDMRKVWISHNIITVVFIQII